MTGEELLGLVYDILAENEVTMQDRQRVVDAIEYVDYEHGKIVFGEQHPTGVVETMDLRLYDHEDN